MVATVKRQHPDRLAAINAEIPLRIVALEEEVMTDVI